MATAGIDHLAMPTANAEKLIAFYKRLGFAINDEEDWRAGKARIFSMQVGVSKINVHPEGYTAGLRGRALTPRYWVQRLVSVHPLSVDGEGDWG